VLLRTNSSPRAFLVYETGKRDQRRSASEETSTRSDLDEASPPEYFTSLSSTDEADLKESGVKFVRFKPNRIELEVEAKRDALLVLAEAWHPGWYARAGENTIPSVAARSWMRAFSLPAGNHHVVVFFRQNYLLLGSLVTFLSGGVLCLVLFKRVQRPRPKSKV
jgi:uncharacterized membrane protein YfhO